MKRSSLLFLILLSVQLVAQDTDWQEFKQLSGPEKRWVLFHPFKAKKAQRASMEARKVTITMQRDPRLDGDTDGGQVDAFRHGYWMVLLCREMRWRKAYRLGKAHEKGNKKASRKNPEDSHDEASMLMDMYNNSVGIDIARSKKEIATEQFIDLVVGQVTSGNYKIIKKNTKGQSLREDDSPIAEMEWIGKWMNERVLVPSNYDRPN